MKPKTTLCTNCGMEISHGEHHPTAACLMYRGCGDGEVVRDNLTSLVKSWRKIGFEEGLESARRRRKQPLRGAAAPKVEAHGSA